MCSVITKILPSLHTLTCFTSCHHTNYATSLWEGHYNLKKYGAPSLLLWYTNKAMEMSFRLQDQLTNFYWLCRLVLHFPDCISDLWTARRSGAVQRSHMMSRKLSRTQPGNEASIPVYQKPWVRAPADFKIFETHTWALVPAARWEGSKYKWGSYFRNAGIRYSTDTSTMTTCILVINICSLQ